MQRCGGGAEQVQRWCRGGAKEVVQSRCRAEQTQRCRYMQMRDDEVKSRCRGAEWVPMFSRGGCTSSDCAGVEVLLRFSRCRGDCADEVVQRFRFR